MQYTFTISDHLLSCKNVRSSHILKIQFFGHVTLCCWADCVALKMKTLKSPGTSGITRTTTRRYSQKTRILSYVAARTKRTPMFQPTYRHSSDVTLSADDCYVRGIHTPVHMYEMIINCHFNIIFRGLIQLICSTNWAGRRINNAATLRKANCKCFVNCIMKHHYCSLDYLLLPCVVTGFYFNEVLYYLRHDSGGISIKVTNMQHSNNN